MSRSSRTQDLDDQREDIRSESHLPPGTTAAAVSSPREADESDWDLPTDKEMDALLGASELSRQKWAGRQIHGSCLLKPDQVKTPEQVGLVGFSDSRIQTEDGKTLRVWSKPARLDMPTIVHFHGRDRTLEAESTYYRLDALSKLGYGVVCFDHRGYGITPLSETDSIQHIIKDDIAVMEHVVNTLGVSRDEIYCMGNSGGTGHAAEMAKKYQTAGLILQSAYTVATHVNAAFSRVAEQCHYQHPVECLRSVKDFAGPVLLLHGVEDRLTGFEDGLALARAAASTGSDVKLVAYTHCGHMDMSKSAAMADVHAFISERSQQSTVALRNEQSVVVEYRIGKGGDTLDSRKTTSGAFLTQDTVHVIGSLAGDNVELQEQLREIAMLADESAKEAGKVSTRVENRSGFLQKAFSANDLLNDIGKILSETPRGPVTQEAYARILAKVESRPEIQKITSGLRALCLRKAPDVEGERANSPLQEVREKISSRFQEVDTASLIKMVQSAFQNYLQTRGTFGVGMWRKFTNTGAVEAAKTLNDLTLAKGHPDGGRAHIMGIILKTLKLDDDNPTKLDITKGSRCEWLLKEMIHAGVLRGDPEKLMGSKTVNELLASDDLAQLPGLRR